jgi:hypothetical protein
MKPWFLLVNVETKELSRQLMHTITKQAKHFKQTSAGKLMATVLWDRKGVLMVKFMQQGTTIMSQVYCGKKTTYSHSEQKAWNADIWCVPPP